MTRNIDIARMLYELGVLSERLDDRSRRFRGRAYRNAAEAVAALDDDVLSLPSEQLAGVPGLGSGTLARIDEIRRTGTIARLEELRALDPGGAEELLRVSGLGPRTVARLRDELGVRRIADLHRALDEQRLRRLRGLGPGTEERLRAALDGLDLDAGPAPIPIAEAVAIATALARAVAAVPGVRSVAWAGALRRFEDTVRTVVLAAVADDPGQALDAVLGLHLVREATASARGPVSRCAVRTFDGASAEIVLTDRDRSGAVLAAETGTEGHWRGLQSAAAGRGLTLRSDGLRDTAGSLVPTPAEDHLYAALAFATVPPEQRDGSDELALAGSSRLPDCAEVADLRGDLHDHTDWSGDGRMSLAALVDAAARRGWEYLAITDHAEQLRINGLDRAAMRAQREELIALRRRHDRLAILHGAELNIIPDGSLDYDDAFLSGFDWTVASVHSAFDLTPEAQTRRLVRAIRHPAVRAIGHLTGRRIGRRAGIRFDLDTVLDACRETGTALEVNCHLDRLDAPAEVLRAAAARGVLVVISTDAHRLRELDNHRWGVRLARRGRVPRDLVTNTWPADRFLAWAAGR